MHRSAQAIQPEASIARSDNLRGQQPDLRMPAFGGKWLPFEKYGAFGAHPGHRTSACWRLTDVDADRQEGGQILPGDYARTRGRRSADKKRTGGSRIVG